MKYFERNYKNHISVPLEYCLGHRENHVAPNTCIYKKKILRKKYYKPDQVVRKQQITCRESRGEEMLKITTEN